LSHPLTQTDPCSRGNTPAAPHLVRSSMFHRSSISLVGAVSWLALCAACGHADPDPLQRAVDLPADGQKMTGTGSALPASPAQGSAAQPNAQGASGDGNSEGGPMPTGLVGGEVASQGLPCGVRGI